MAWGRSGSSGSRAIFRRVAGNARGAQFAQLAVSTVRAVAVGVIGIAQVPVVIVALPAIVYIWWSGDHGNFAAIAYTVLLAVAASTRQCRSSCLVR